MKNTIKKISCLMAATASSIITSFNSYALGRIDNEIAAEEFSSMTLDNASGVIVGVVFWILRLIGFLLIVFGIYTMSTSKKDGDADEINVGLIKLIAGALFFAIPAILNKIGLVG